MPIGKRVTVSTLAGLLFGLVCYGFASSGQQTVPGPVLLQLLTSRLLLGFGIGISRLSLGHWSLHGLAMGLIFSIPLGFGSLMSEVPGFSPWTLFTMTVVMGMIYGVLIELITTVLFKAPIQKALPTPVAV